MRIPLLLVLPALLVPAACGSSHDRDPEKVREPIVVYQGDFVEGQVRTDDSYPFLDWYRYEDDVDDLPLGFDYDTFDVFFDSWDRLWVEYELSIASWVEPGEYRFSVTYDFYDVGSIFREEVEFRFYVAVVEGFPHAEKVVIQAQQGLEPEERAEGADAEIVIGGE
jgi:hypothetical protein